MTDNLPIPPSLSFLRSVFSEADGAGSMSRIGTMLVVVFALAWVTYLVVRHDVLPDLSGLAIWVVSISTSLYGVNRLADVVQTATQKDKS